MATVKFQLETLSCPSCIKKIETVLNKQMGVKEASVLFHSSKVKIAFDETKYNSRTARENNHKTWLSSYKCKGMIGNYIIG